VNKYLIGLVQKVFFGVSPKGDLRSVARHFQWNRGGLAAHRMMLADDTRGDVWASAGAWEFLACVGGAA
jgi:hypothetical protein